MQALLHSVPTAMQQATIDTHLCGRILDTPGQVWVSLLWGRCSFLLGPSVHKVLSVPPRVCFPVLCKLWQRYAGANGDLLEEDLCHTQVYGTQSPCPWGQPLLTCTSSGDTQTQLWLISCGASGSWCVQGFFEPSDHLWWGKWIKLISFNSKSDFAPLIILLELLLCPWTWDIFFWWDPTFPYNYTVEVTKSRD